MRDTLFLLPPGFEDNGRREYCPECAEAWGLLAYYPAIRESLDIIYEPIAHPRPGLVARLGEGAWNCPTLVLSAASANTVPKAVQARVKSENDVSYFGSARDIGAYYAARFGTAHPRGG